MRNKGMLNRFVGWFTATQYCLKSFSILRIFYGTALMAVLLPSMRDRSLLWGEASFWVDPEASRRGYWTFDTLFSKDSSLLFDVAYFGLILVVTAFILGWRTRVVTPVLLLLVVSLQSNNPYVLNGGDTLLRLTLLFMLFANLSEYYSLDARRRKKQRTRKNRFIPAYVRNVAHNTAWILSCLQIIVVYTTSGVWKLLGQDWLSSTALFYALRIDNFMLYPKVNELLWQSNLVIYVATFLALWVQALFGLLILWRPTKIFALVSLIFMHTGIAVLLGLWPFSLIMIALDLLFVSDETWQRTLKRLHSTRAYRRTAAQRDEIKGLVSGGSKILFRSQS